MEMNKIINGDCIEKLKELDDNSIDAIITDPPYELGFMGKKWDNKGIAYNVELWKECLRVVKHGGFLLAFGGTRTYHRMTCAIEDSGFEIRDCIMWLYGSGFPKSLNVGKQIDKMQGNEREVVGKEKGAGTTGNNKVGNQTFVAKNQYNDGTHDLTKGNSEYEGWGTALKPACEPIVVARKPLSERTVALNVLKWGTGGINIDGCRIGTDGGTKHIDGEKEYDNEIYGKGLYKAFGKTIDNLGRFPANIILDEEAGKLFPDDVEEYDGLKQETLFGDVLDNKNNSASRFFYCAKAGKSERDFGCEELDKGNVGHGNLSNSKGFERFDTKGKNTHPTVKPIQLIEYLIKLVSKENAIILDPFLGSGTTAIACVKLNRKYIGIEKEEEYIKIAQARIKHYAKQQKLFNF